MFGCHANSDGTVTLKKALGLPLFIPTIIDTYEPLPDGRFRKTTEYSSFPGSCPSSGDTSLEEKVSKKDLPLAVRYELWKLERKKDT